MLVKEHRSRRISPSRTLQSIACNCQRDGHRKSQAICLSQGYQTEKLEARTVKFKRSIKQWKPHERPLKKFRNLKKKTYPGILKGKMIGRTKKSNEGR